MNNTLRYPPSVDWETTSECNHNCIHCYNYWRKKSGGSRAVQPKEYYIRCAERLIESKPVSVQITGGEPLLVWERIKDAILMLIDAGINVSINTNATLVDDEKAAFLAEHKIDAFVSFPCSRAEVFDRIVNRDGAKERAEKGILMLIRHGVRVSPNMVVTRLNLPYVFETAQYVKEVFGVSYFSATKASFPQNADASFRSQMLSGDEFNDMLSSLLRVKEELGMRVDSAWVYSLCGFADDCTMQEFGFNRKCVCGRYNFVLDSSAYMKACGCDSNSYGNLFEQTFESAIARMNAWQDASLLAPECKTCSALKYCGGGCRADSLSTNGAYCTLDSTANLKHYNRAIPASRETVRVDENLTVALNRAAVFVREKSCLRVSFRTNYEFISEELAEFLSSRERFSVAQLMLASGQDDEQVWQCIQKLLKKGFLLECTEPADETEVEKGCFALMCSPYVSNGSSRLIRDYAGSENNSKRYS